MTANELLKYQLDDAGYQLDQVLAGFPEDALDRRFDALTYTPRESVAHLCEAYHALTMDLAGQKYEWGSYKVADCSTQAIMSEFRKLRSAAISGVMNGGEDALKKGHMFVIGHDYYHVGQLCGSRLAADPEWDAYSIYR